MALSGMSEELLPVLAPIIAYWVGVAIYELTLTKKDEHRLFTKEEEDTQNLATRRQVLVGVIINQAMQMILTTLLFMGSGGLTSTSSAAPTSPSLLRIAGQLAVAMLVMDCWEYWWHRWTHEIKFLYKHVHAMHHHLVVPYTYGAQYVHPVDALLSEIVGGMIATLVSGMSPRTAAVFFTVLTLKGLDDHCGMWFPNHPIHRWMTNNAAFHCLHHQHVGIKHNYSVHFLATWDLLTGTYLPFSVEPRKGGGGGYHLRTAKDHL